MSREVREAAIISIVEFFKDLEDPRSSKNRKHLLSDLNVIWATTVTPANLFF